MLDPPSVLHWYPLRQSASLVHVSMQPAESALIAVSTQTLPAGHAAPPTTHALLHIPPGAKSRLRHTPGPHSVLTVHGSPMTGPHALRPNDAATRSTRIHMGRLESPPSWQPVSFHRSRFIDA